MYVRLFSAIWLLLCAWLAVIAWGFQAPFAYDPVGPRAYPLLLLALMGAGSLWLIIKPGMLEQRLDVPMALRSALCVVVLLAYALTVAKHLVFRHSQPQLQSLQPEDDLVDPNTDLEQQLLAQEQQRLLQQALASLPPLRRDVLIRRRLKQQSREQIARELGISEEAVKKHISRALAQLASLHPSER